MKKFILSSFLYLLLLSSCSTTQTHSTHVAPTAHPRAIEVQHIDQGEDANGEAPSSPALTLVSEGIEKFKNELMDDAEWKFEEAVNLDPNYGPAYYWLARVKHRLDDDAQCLELLKKAETLMDDSEVWNERIAEFREILSSVSDEQITNSLSR